MCYNIFSTSKLSTMSKITRNSYNTQNPSQLVLFTTFPSLDAQNNRSLNLVNKNFFSIKLKFRSFFGFLKAKPFVNNALYKFLNNFYINPKPNALSQIISQTKKYSSSSIQKTFDTNTAPTINSYVTKIGLQHVISKTRIFSLQSARFSLIKHRVYKYTTPPRSKTSILANLTLQLSVLGDLRMGLAHKHTPQGEVYNSTTISTYNWKTIN